MQKKALGRGLEALIPASVGREARDVVASAAVTDLPLAVISVNPYQPRRAFKGAALQELADSIKTKGVIQPVIVRRLGDGQLELIAGERRLRAAKLAGVNTIPAVIRSATDAESMEVALIENLQREDLNPLEAATAYQRLLKEFKLTQEDLALRIGKERSSIANTVRLLSLPHEVRGWIEEEQLSLGHAKVLLGLSDPNEQIRLGRQAVKKRLSVRDLERLLQKAPRSGARVSRRKGPLNVMEDQLIRRLATKVRVIEGKIGGKIVIEYYSAAEFERIVEMILG
jgi:ParB family transcriptional regulator, chromosome partitioning protein